VLLLLLIPPVLHVPTLTFTVTSGPKSLEGQGTQAPPE
jgi:hypothetical protein